MCHPPTDAVFPNEEEHITHTYILIQLEDIVMGTICILI